MKKNIFELPLFKWLGNIAIPLILGSFIISGSLAMFSSKYELTKFIYDQEYKEFQKQFRFYREKQEEYIGAIQSYLAIYKIMRKHFDFNEVAKNNNENYRGTFQSVALTFKDFGDKRVQLAKESIIALNQLSDSYKNLSLLLGFQEELKQYDSKYKEPFYQKIKILNNEKAQSQPDYSHLVGSMVKKDDDDSINGLIYFINNMFDDANFLSIVSKEVEVEIERYNLEIKKYKIFSEYYSNKLIEQLDKSLFRYLGEVFGI